MNTLGENVTRVPNVASRRRAASASSSSRGSCSRSVHGSTARRCDTSGSPEPLPPLAELYRSAPAEFVATRDRLVRELKAAGDTDAARTLAKRKKPTRAAHAVNTLAHEHPDDVGAYLDLAADMRAAQIAAARDDAARDELRTRDRERRDRLAALLARVPDDRDEVERALTTALVDSEVADAVRAGTLERIPDAPSGFDAFAADLGDVPVATARARRGPKRRDEASAGSTTRSPRRQEARRHRTQRRTASARLPSTKPNATRAAAGRRLDEAAAAARTRLEC